MNMIVDELLKNGVMGVFLVILLFFARKVLTNLEAFLKEAKEDKKNDVEIYRQMVDKISDQRETLHKAHADQKDELYDKHSKDMHEITTTVLATLNENSLAYKAFADSLFKIASINEVVFQSVNNQNLILEYINSKLEQTDSPIKTESWQTKSSK